MAANNAPRGPCAVCGAGSGLACAGCTRVWYCGAPHQREHWPQHRQHCACYELRSNETLGRHLVATRDIKAGTVILKEKPLVAYPCWNTSSWETPSCGNCLRRVRLWTPCPQPQCGLPLCSADCVSQVGPASLHTPTECKLLQTARASSKFRGDSAVVLLRAVGVLRCLLLKDKKAATFHSLLSNIGASDSAEFWHAIEGWRSLMQCLFPAKFKEEDLRFAAAVLQTNAHTILEDEFNILGYALYWKSSLLAHSCTPNAKHLFFGKTATDFTGAVRANVDIKSGDVITVRYVDILEPTYTRRESLLKQRHFLCRCPRCEDPTELGLYYGTTCCPRCRDRKKRMSLLEPSGMEDRSVCRCKVCGFKTTLRSVMALIGAEVQEDADDESSPDPSRREQFIQRHLYPRGLFHPTSELIVLAKKRLLDFYGNTPGYSYKELSEEQLSRKLTLCREVLPVLDIAAPGHTNVRGDLLVETVHTLVELGHRALRRSERDCEAAKVALEEATTVFAEVKNIFSQPSKVLKLKKIEQKLQDLLAVLRKPEVS